MNGQVIDSRNLQLPGKPKRRGELGGHEFQRWLGAWAIEARAGRRISVLVSVMSFHVVVVEES